MRVSQLPEALPGVWLLVSPSDVGWIAGQKMSNRMVMVIIFYHCNACLSFKERALLLTRVSVWEAQRVIFTCIYG